MSVTVSIGEFCVLPDGDPNGASKCLGNKVFEVPFGWEVVRTTDADFESVRTEVIAKYKWSTSVVVVAMDVDLGKYAGYCSKGFNTPGDVWPEFSKEMLTKVSDTEFKFLGGHCRLLIRRSAGFPKRKRDPADEICSKMHSIFRTRCFTDAKVHCGDQTFEVHRVVLSASSPVFDAMFKSDAMKEGAERAVTIDNASPAAVGAMLEYMYVADVPVDTDAASLTKLADQYQVEGLLRMCGDLLIDKLTEQNVVATVRVLQPLRSHDTMFVVWEELLGRVHEDRSLFRQVMGTI